MSFGAGLLVPICTLLLASSAWAQRNLFSHSGDFLEGEISAIGFGFTKEHHGLLMAGARDGTLFVFDLDAQEERARRRHARRIVALASVVQKALVAGDDRDAVFVWDWKSDATRQLTRLDDDVRSIDVSADGRLVAAASKKSVTVFDLETSAITANLSDRRQRDDLLYASFVEGGESLVTLSKDKVHILWNLQNQRALRTNVEEFDEIFAAAYSPSGIFAIAAVDIFSQGSSPTATDRGDLDMRNPFGRWVDKIKIVDLKGDGREIKILDGQGQDENIAFISISADNKYIATSGNSGTVKIWDILRGSEVSLLHTDEDVRDVAFSPDGRWLVAATKRGIRVWQTAGIIPHPAYSAWLLGDFVYSRDEPPLLDFDRLATVGLVPFDAPEHLLPAARTVTNLMLEYLANGDGFQLVDQDALNSVLDVRAFQLTGLTQERQTELAKLPNLDWLLMGSLRQLGANMLLNVKLVNIETGFTDGARTVECRQCAEEDLPVAVQRLARLTVK